MITSFTIENYKSFSRKQVIDLKPITVFFGWNSGGKSALLRFLPLLSESISNGNSPLWLEGNVGKSNPWSSFTCKATERSNINFSLTWKDKKNSVIDEIAWEVLGDPAGAWQQIESFKFNRTDHKDGINNIKISLSQEQCLAFKSIIPDKEFKNEHGELAITIDNIEKIGDKIEWLGGIRKKTPRVIQFSGSSSNKTNMDGGNSIANLIGSYQKNSNAEDYLFVKSFFNELGEELSFNNSNNGLWQIMLQPILNSRVRVDLCDTGEGYSQVIPVLVSLAKLHVNESAITCIEQPELHLHTRAQVILAKKIIEAVNNEKNEHISTAIIETHSEIFLTSIQLEIAKKNIDHNMVRLYWIDSREDGTSDAIPIDFDELGRPSNPVLFTAFQEAVDLSQDLIKTQLGR